VERGEPLADRDVIDLAYVELAARSRRGVCGREVFVELAEVDAVVAERVLAGVALVAQVLEELFE
jgi:hypothetical protein